MKSPTTQGRAGLWCKIAAAALAVVTLYVPALASAGVTTTFFHNDGAGSPVLATDVNGLQAWRETYRPYGDRLIQSAASSNNKLWFGGKQFDSNTGLIYLGRRYYDPTAGRFMGIDPLPVDFNNFYTFNRYAYANNNPYKFVDPSGEASEGGDEIEGVTVYGRDDYVDPGLVDFLLHASRELELSYGKDSWSLAFCNVTACAAADAVNDALNGDYTGATFAAAAFFVKPLKVIPFGGLKKAAKFGVKPYNELRKLLRGSGLQSHHLIEKRFAELFGQNARKMLAVAVTKAEHQAFTNAWRKAIPYGTKVRELSREYVEDKAREIYKGYSEILNQLDL